MSSAKKVGPYNLIVDKHFLYAFSTLAMPMISGLNASPLIAKQCDPLFSSVIPGIVAPKPSTGNDLLES
jgi:hypothetical protein